MTAVTESSEKFLRKRLLEAVGAENLKSFQRHRPGRVIWTFLHIWIGIFLAIGIGAAIWKAASPWIAGFLLPVVFYIGSRQNALGVQIHEAAHHLLFPNRKLNDAFCNLFGAYWVMNDVASYRRVHLVHHTDLHRETDPDRDLYDLPRRRLEVIGRLLRDFFWITALGRVRSYLRLDRERSRGRAPGAARHTAAKLGCQAVLLGGACALVGWRQGPWFYLLLWWIPLFSVFPLILRLRIVAEHHGTRRGADAVWPFVSRTTAANPLEIYLFGCDMEYHFEHHLLPTIPHPQLARLHARLAKSGFFSGLPPAAPSRNYLSGGYLRFWARLLARESVE